MVKFMIQKDRHGDDLLTAEDVKTCLGLASITLSAATVARLLRSAAADTDPRPGDRRRYNLALVAASLHAAADTEVW